MKKVTIREALFDASEFLKKHHLEQPVAEWLLRHYLNKNRTELLLSLDEELDEDVLTRFCDDLRRHATGVPVQYLIGYEYFYGRRFLVNEHVLIPRPETEELIESVITWKKTLFNGQDVTIADIGTGSGVIAITLALEIGGDVIATDLSFDALSVAKKNAEALRANVTFLHGDLIEPLLTLDKKIDILVSNPPYIPLKDKATLPKNVRDFEPPLALFGGDDGLDVYRRLIPALPSVINRPALIAFEVGAGQSEDVVTLLQQTFPDEKADVIYDINGKDRIVLIALQQA